MRHSSLSWILPSSLSIALVIRLGSNRQARVEHNRNHHPRQTLLLEIPSRSLHRHRVFDCLHFPESLWSSQFFEESADYSRQTFD